MSSRAELTVALHKHLCSCSDLKEHGDLYPSLAQALYHTMSLAWDEGYDAGDRDARAVNKDWPERTFNPYRETDEH